MAVFVAFADGSIGGAEGAQFRFGGFVAPLRDWDEFFIPAWEERVLRRDPPIDYFHTAELSDPDGCAKFGLTWGEGDQKIEEATSVITGSGSLILVDDVLSAKCFAESFGNIKLISSSPQPCAYPHAPDYLGFGQFAVMVLDFVDKSRPEAEKVDFVVESNGRVDRYLPEIYDSTRDYLATLNRPSLVKLMGTLIPGDKERVPLQAADCACWHLQKIATGKYTRTEWKRYLRIAKRKGRNHIWPDDELRAMAARIKERNRPSPFPPKQPYRREAS